MKKILIVVITALVAFSVHAQLRTSRTFTKVKSRTEKIIRLGASVNNMAGTDDLEPGASFGFDLNFGFNQYFGQSSAYWGMEIGIGTRGFSYEDSWDDKETTTAYDIKWSPFTVGYKIPITEQFRIDPHLGLYTSYDFAYSGWELSSPWDVGLQLGVGVWFDHLGLDFMYQRGFIDAEPYVSWYDNGYTSNFLIRLGYSF